MTHSLGGGTGAGMGTLLISKIREELRCWNNGSSSENDDWLIVDEIVDDFSITFWRRFLRYTTNYMKMILNFEANEDY